MKYELSRVFWRRLEMDKENARKQTLEQLHEWRKQVARLHRKGIKIMQIVLMTGLSDPAVRATLDRFVEGGWASIRPATRGRAREEIEISRNSASTKFLPLQRTA